MSQGPRTPGREGREQIEASGAPLLAHLLELRARLLKALAALAVGFGVCFYFAPEIFDLLLGPYVRATGGGPEAQLIYTAPQEFLFTQVRLAMFGAVVLAFPVLAGQVYMFVAPGLYRDERRAFLPFLAAAPVLFVLGAALVYAVIMPLAMRFFLGMEQAGGAGQAGIALLPRVSEYLGLIMGLILAFGLCFQLPVLLTLLARAGLVSSAHLRAGRKYAVVGLFALAAILTPPDVISQVGLAVPTLLLYEAAIVCVVWVERARARAQKTADRADAGA